MGFFSWNCKHCGHPMLSVYAIQTENGWMNDVVVIEPTGNMLQGEYDGYGRVAEVDIQYTFDKADPDCYHFLCWEKVGCPKEYKGGSKYADDQGYFFEDNAHNIPSNLITPHKDKEEA